MNTKFRKKPLAAKEVAKTGQPDGPRSRGISGGRLNVPDEWRDEMRAALLAKLRVIAAPLRRGEFDVDRQDRELLEEGLHDGLFQNRESRDRAMNLVNRWHLRPAENRTPAKPPAIESAPRSPLPAPCHSDGNQLRVFEQSLAIGLVDPSPWQKRKDFGALQGLAESLKTLGLRQAILVRPGRNGHFELLAGERRLRAARLLGWETIRASVQDCDDRTAREVVAVENLQRKDLDPIEEAREWQDLLTGAADGTPAPTQTELAARLGVTQGHISNRLRLLRLPALVQEAVISGEISKTRARDLVQIADAPAVVDELLKSYRERKKWQKWVTLADLVNENVDGGVDAAIEAATKPMQGEWYCSANGRRYPYFTPTEAQRAELDVREFVMDGFEGPHKERRALNVKLWDELQAAHALATSGKIKKKGEKAPVKKPTEMTAAQRKMAAETERLKKKVRRAQLQRRRGELATDFLRFLISRRLAQEATFEELLELTTLAALHGWAGNSYTARHVAQAVRKIKDRPIADRAARLAAELFWISEQDGPSSLVAGGHVGTIAGFLDIDVAAAWRSGQLGPLSEAWWNAHDREELLKLGGYHGGDFPSVKKGQLVAKLLAEKGLVLPAELSKLVKAKTAKTGKGKSTKGTKKKSQVGGRSEADLDKLDNGQSDEDDDFDEADPVLDPGDDFEEEDA